MPKADDLRHCLRGQPHSVAALIRYTMIPPAAAEAREDGTLRSAALQAMFLPGPPSRSAGAS